MKEPAAKDGTVGYDQLRAYRAQSVQSRTIKCFGCHHASDKVTFDNDKERIM